MKPVIELKNCQQYSVLNLDLTEENGRVSVSENIKNSIEDRGLVGIKFEETASN